MRKKGKKNKAVKIKKKKPMPDHKKFQNEKNKYDKYFSEKPGNP